MVTAKDRLDSPKRLMPPFWLHEGLLLCLMPAWVSLLSVDGVWLHSSRGGQRKPSTKIRYGLAPHSRGDSDPGQKSYCAPDLLQTSHPPQDALDSHDLARAEAHGKSREQACGRKRASSNRAPVISRDLTSPFPVCGTCPRAKR